MVYFKVGEVYEKHGILYKITKVDGSGTLLLDKCKWYQCLWYRIRGLFRG